MPEKGYWVIPVEEPANGRFYQSYCAEWLTWLVSNNPEATNYGPVYFLHCLNYQGEQDTNNYANQPLIRIGSQALNIRPGEFIFFPVITSFAETVDSGVQDDPTSLLNYVRTYMEAGDKPLHESQATIIDATDSSNPGLAEPIVNNLASHQVITDVFPLYVPPVQPGARLLRTSIDVPIITEGVRNARIGGWFLLIQFYVPDRKYYIHTFARGRGQYLAGMFHEINVVGSVPEYMMAPKKPQVDWSASIIKNALKAKKDIGEIDNERFTLLSSILK